MKTNSTNSDSAPLPGTQATFEDYLRVLSARRWLLGSIVTVAVAITAIINFRMPNQYRAIATVQINKEEPRVVKQEQVMRPQDQGLEFLQTQHKILQSRALAERVIQRLSLDKNPEFSGNPPASGQKRDLVKAYYACLAIVPIRMTLLAQVAVTLKDPALAAQIANVHAEEYVHLTLEQKAGIGQEATRWLQQQVVDMQTRLQKSETALQEYRIAHSMVSSIETEEKLIEKYKADLPQKSAEVAKLEERYLHKHPALIQAKSELEDLRNLIKTKEALLVDLREKNIEYEPLKRQADTDHLLYESLLTRVKEVGVSKSLDATNITILDRAVEPTEKYRPRRLINILVAFVLSLMGGGVFCFVLESLTETVRGPEDIADPFGVPYLGCVPHFAANGAEQDALQPYEVSPEISEAFRAVLAILSLKPETAQAKSFIITSAVPKEGKSSCAVQLATAFAQKDLKTLLVEADLRRPVLLKSLGIESKGGLDALAKGKCAARDLIQPTRLANLSAVVACQSISNSHHLLASKAVLEFIEEARQRFDRVVIDTPPIGAVSDALGLCQHTDGVIWVTRFDTARKKMVLNAFSRLFEIKATIIGVIINDIDFSDSHNSYYYYHSGYGAYYGDGEDSKSVPTGRFLPDSAIKIPFSRAREKVKDRTRAFIHRIGKRR
ncbi:MAG: polysaccharide biosynthesis tyrosine autokinase [Verrucomicrobia bacterium]|nr:polysaccharide biosynthesis tyrosine autokinase [Verrucomicrobiota bacterium]